MEKCLLLILSLSVCSGHGHLGKLSGFLIGAGQEIHNKVHDVAGAVLGGLSFNVHGHVNHQQQPAQQQPAQQQPSRGGETIVVIVEETGQGNQGQPQNPYGTTQQGQYRPPHGYNPDQGYNPNQGHNPNQGYNPLPNLPVNYGQGPYQNGQNNGNYGNNQNYPNRPGQNYNQNGQENHNIFNGNANPNENGYGNPNNNPNPNVNEVKNPEQNKPNINGNYKPTEAYNEQQHNDGHQADNTHKETNDKATKKPEDDGPLFVPLIDYTYGGDKITVKPPKRETDKATTEKIEEFPIDIRFKDE